MQTALEVAVYLTSVPAGTTVVTGGAAGADTYAEEFAWRHPQLESEVHPADWKKWGSAAGPIRNREMLNTGIDQVVAFWDGKSRGTGHMIEISQAAGVPVEIVRVQE